jgi:hypothetical protein
VNYDKKQQLMYSLEKDCFWSESSTRRFNVSNSVNLYFVFDIYDCHFNWTEFTWAAMSVYFLRKSVIYLAQLNIICNFLSMSGIYGATLEDPGSTVTCYCVPLAVSGRISGWAPSPPPFEPTREIRNKEEEVHKRGSALSICQLRLRSFFNRLPRSPIRQRCSL